MGDDQNTDAPGIFKGAAHEFGIGDRFPVVRNRNLALKTLAAWGRDRWPAGAAEALARALHAEPKDDIRERIRKVIEGEPLS